MSEVETGLPPQPTNAYDANDIALGEDSRGAREVLPESYYPVKLAVESFASSANKGTPGLRLFLTVLEGPYAGRELNESIWLTPGGPQAKTEGRSLGKINHMIHQVTGEYPDSQTIKRYEVPLTDPSDTRAVFKDLWLYFNTLTSEQKLDFMAQYARTKLWDGKKVVAFVQCSEEEMMRDGEPIMDDETGQPRTIWRNSIGNLYAWNDAKQGYAAWKNTHKPLQEQQVAAQTGADG